MDERRITKTSELYKQYADCHRSVLPIVSKCLDDITMEAEKISPAEVSNAIDELPHDVNRPSLWAVRNTQPCVLRENGVQRVHISQNSLPDWLVNNRVVA